MSGPRRLWVRFRLVDSGRRAAYRDAATAAGRVAESLGAHFWSFEADGEGAPVIEFLEGPGDAVLEGLDGRIEPDLGAAAGARAPHEMLVPAGGMRSTEVRADGRNAADLTCDG